MFKSFPGFLCLIAILIPPLSAEAEPGAEFILSKQSSRVTFHIQSVLLPLAGTINSFSGTVNTLTDSPDNYELVLNCDLSSVKLTGEQLQGLPVAQLLQSVKGSSANFRGSSVAKLKDGTIRFKGELKWRGQKYDVVFPVKIKRVTANQIQIDGSVNSDGAELVEELPVLAVFQVESATASGQLNFVK